MNTIDAAFLLLQMSCCCIAVTRAEFIFRGTCSSLFQPQEIAVTFDVSDVVFNLYVIQPGSKIVGGQSQCQADCLGTRNPPCRTAFYDPSRSTCWLLRADKQAALEFDTKGSGLSPITGILIAPQTIQDYVNDPAFGVPNCTAFCPAPASQSADTVTPVCVQDCPNSNPSCAGELSGCIDYPKRVTTYQALTNLYYTGSFPNQMAQVSFVKKYDYTSIRISLFMGSWSWDTAGGSSSNLDEHYVYANIVGSWGTQSCYGDAGAIVSINRQKFESYSGSTIYEPGYVEFLCTFYDYTAGSYNINLMYNRGYPYTSYYTVYSGSAAAPGAGINGGSPPFYIHVEEFIPSARNGYLKLDDMARCQSMTVFNTYSVQFPTTAMANPAAGRTPYVVWKYKKRSDTSSLRIMWTAVVFLDTLWTTVHFYFTINDQLCKSPNTIETCIRDGSYVGGGTARPSPIGDTISLDGLCRGLPAGRYDIALWLDFTCTFYPVSNTWNYLNVGQYRPATFVVEEIHENLPVNALLLSDGSLAQMPYYNRKYFVFTTGCEASANSSCQNPVATFTYNKLQTNSAIHVKWYGTQQQCSNSAVSRNEAARFNIQINGAECASPTRIESWWVDMGVTAGYCRLRPKYVEGICRSIPSGPVTLTLAVLSANWNTFIMLYGVSVGGTSYLMVEEIYDGSI